MMRKPKHAFWHYECSKEGCGSKRFIVYATEWLVKHTDERGHCGMGEVEDVITRGVKCEECGEDAEIIIEQ